MLERIQAAQDVSIALRLNLRSERLRLPLAIDIGSDDQSDSTHLNLSEQNLPTRLLGLRARRRPRPDGRLLRDLQFLRLWQVLVDVLHRRRRMKIRERGSIPDAQTRTNQKHNDVLHLFFLRGY